VNERKCELITNDAYAIRRVQSIAPDVIIVEPSAAILLSAPVGGDHSIDFVLQNKLTELKRLSDRWKQLNTHDAFYLLRIVSVCRSCNIFSDARLASTVP